MQKNIKILSASMRYALLACVVAFGWIAIVATGGGGGSGGGSTEVSYTGVETQAAIDESNAQELLIGAYTGGEIGNITAGVAGVQVEGADDTASPNLFDFSRALEDALRRVDPGAALYEADRISGFSDRNSLPPGSCGGGATYSITGNDQTGEFSGSITFNGYCDQGITFSGTVQFSGLVDVSSPPPYPLLNFQFRFSTLAANMDGESITMSGSLAIDVSGTPQTVTMNMRIRYGGTGKVYWVRNYQIRMNEVSDCVEIEASGRFYHPEHGYVNIDPASSFLVCEGEECPHDGFLIVTGTAGTSARVTFYPASPENTLQIEADTDGDGEYDDYFVELYCSDVN